MAESHYFDPDTGMIHLYKDSAFSNTIGASLDMELGLSTFPELTDVKVKVVSIEYKVKTVTDSFSATPAPGGTAADNNLYAFNNEEAQSGGNYLVGIKNQADTAVYNDLADFTGSSAWPVQITSWFSQIGLPASMTKTWKPRKLGLSDEQVAFLTVRNNSGVNNARNCYSWASIVMRLIRL
jgi:hypothetical protein